MQFYGRLFLLLRALVRIFTPRYQVLHPERLEEPAVYLCRHADLHGILINLLWLPVPVHTWGLSTFGETKPCYEHLRTITFMGRYGWPRWLSTLAARLASWGLPALYRTARVIPVYRGSGEVIKTFRQSIEALQRGENLLIFPDKDYANTESDVTDLYDGFLRIDRFYHRRTGQHVPFIPLYADRKRRTLAVGEPLRFSNSSDKNEINAMLEILKERLSGYNV